MIDSGPAEGVYFVEELSEPIAIGRWPAADESIQKLPPPLEQSDGLVQHLAPVTKCAVAQRILDISFVFRGQLFTHGWSTNLAINRTPILPGFPRLVKEIRDRKGKTVRAAPRTGREKAFSSPLKKGTVIVGRVGARTHAYGHFNLFAWMQAPTLLLQPTAGAGTFFPLSARRRAIRRRRWDTHRALEGSVAWPVGFPASPTNEYCWNWRGNTRLRGQPSQ